MKRVRAWMLNVLELPLGAVTRVVVQSGRFDSLFQRKEPTAGPVLKTRARTLNRRRKRRFTESVEFPRWVVAAGVLLIGFVLLLGALADDSGKLRMPGAGAVLYVAAVIGVAAVLLHSRRSRHSPAKDRREPLRPLGPCICPEVLVESPTLRREEGKSTTQRAQRR